MSKAMSTILGIEPPEGVRLKRQRGLVVLAPEAKAIADAALPRMERLRACSIRAMSAMGHVLEAQGETDTPTLFDGWARLFFSKVASKREAAIQAFDAAMERWTQEAAAKAKAATTAKAKEVSESVKRAREAAKTLEEALHKDGDKAAAEEEDYETFVARCAAAAVAANSGLVGVSMWGERYPFGAAGAPDPPWAQDPSWPLGKAAKAAAEK